MASIDPSRLTKAKAAAERCHNRIPYLRKLPVPVVGIIITVAVANLLCWAGTGVALVCSLGNIPILSNLILNHIGGGWREMVSLLTVCCSIFIGLFTLVLQIMILHGPNNAGLLTKTDSMLKAR